MHLTINKMIAYVLRENTHDTIHLIILFTINFALNVYSLVGCNYEFSIIYKGLKLKMFSCIAVPCLNFLKCIVFIYLLKRIFVYVLGKRFW